MQFQLLPHLVREDMPLIYMWEIREQDGALLGRYVGKAKMGANRPLTHYTRNVTNILAGKPYRKSKPDGYRRIHRTLAQAAEQGLAVTLQFLCNVQPSEDIDHVEQRHIREQNCRGSASWQLNG